MTKPTVGVVRFQESDVIVASLRVSGFTKADGIRNGTMTFNGVTADYGHYGSGTPTSFIALITSAGCGTRMNSITYSTDYTGTPTYRLEDLFEADWSENEDGNFAFAANGTYHWDAAENTWKQ